MAIIVLVINCVLLQAQTAMAELQYTGCFCRDKSCYFTCPCVKAGRICGAMCDCSSECVNRIVTSWPTTSKQTHYNQISGATAPAQPSSNYGNVMDVQRQAVNLLAPSGPNLLLRPPAPLNLPAPETQSLGRAVHVSTCSCSP